MSRDDPSSVTAVVRRRRSVRAFSDRPVDPELLRQILDTARFSPSGGNLQPWHVIVLGGEALAGLKAVMRTRLENPRAPNEGAEYPIYPAQLREPYRSRRFQCAEDMYATMGISRADKDARYAFIAGNFQFWNAPVGLFFCVDRDMGGPQWSDLGMYIQTVMLLAVEAGLDCCAQEAWTHWYRTVGDYLRLPSERMMFCGLALGYRDDSHPVNQLRTARAPLHEIVEFRGL